jgi:hypothetical protein
MRKCSGERVRKYTEAQPRKITGSRARGPGGPVSARRALRQDRIEVSGYPVEAVCREDGPHASPLASCAHQLASGHPKRRMEPLDGPFL